ncbi:MAG TPA: VWA domain-containing protein, partial [Pirellulales bacterium]|nr:VWA domain-containing protein [Pirellulales bacterium]
MNGTLPPWLERWLDVPAAGSGEGTAWTLDDRWNWAPWATLVFVGLAAAWVLFWYAREVATAGRSWRLLLATIRLTLVGLLLFMLAEFVLSLNRTGLPYVVVLLDDSASMSTVDRYEDKKLAKTVATRIETAGLSEATRLNLGKCLLSANDGDLLAAIARRFKLKTYFVSAAARPQAGDPADVAKAVEALEATGESSRLGQAVETVLDDFRGNLPSAIVLLSDGINTEGDTLADAAAQARRKGVPLFTVALGSETPIRDLELSDLLVDEVVFVDDVVNFDFKVMGTGLEGRQVSVVLRRKGEQAPLAETTVTIAADGQPQRVRLPYRPTEVGDFDYVVEIDPLAEENQRDNNREQRRVSVRDEQVRVLLVQSYPSYEFRYLKNLLERDKTVRVRTVLQEADPEYVQLDETALAVFPVRRDELFEYDVVIFGDVNPAFLSPSALENIVAFVEEKGGGVIFISGPLYTPLEYRDTALAELLPIEFAGAVGADPGRVVNEPFQLQPTELGLTGPTMQLGDTPAETIEIWRKLPSLYCFFEAPALKPAARVWAEHPLRGATDGRRLPLAAMQYVGSGKVVFHATDETWRWRFRVGD